MGINKKKSYPQMILDCIVENGKTEKEIFDYIDQIMNQNKEMANSKVLFTSLKRLCNKGKINVNWIPNKNKETSKPLRYISLAKKNRKIKIYRINKFDKLADYLKKHYTKYVVSNGRVYNGSFYLYNACNRFENYQDDSIYVSALPENIESISICDTGKICLPEFRIYVIVHKSDTFAKEEINKYHNNLKYCSYEIVDLDSSLQNNFEIYSVLFSKENYDDRYIDQISSDGFIKKTRFSVCSSVDHFLYPYFSIIYSSNLIILIKAKSNSEKIIESIINYLDSL
jgi:hypothetical protein